MDHGQLQAHWDDKYRVHDSQQLSWYQPVPTASLRMIASAGAQPDAKVIDVGGGTSTLVDGLLDAGYRAVTVLDISGIALSQAKSRLSARESTVNWIESDVTTVRLPLAHFDLWHDRAVFHFLTSAAQRHAYRDSLLRSLKHGGSLIIATFFGGGMGQCSGLPVVRYSASTLAQELGPEFRLLEQQTETHQTPAGRTQTFLYCRFQRVGE